MNDGLRKAVFFPCAVNIAQTGAGTFSHVYQGKHIEDSCVSCVAYPSRYGILYADSKGSRIGYGDFAEVFIDDNSLPPVIIGVNQCIGQCLSDGCVYRCVIDSHHLFIQLERFFHIGGQFPDDSKVKIKDISTPVTVTTAYPV